MRKNKGFTLVELLAILVILGLIALATIPNISKQVKESEKQEQTVLDKKIENAAKLYADKYFADDIVKGSNTNKIIKTFTLTDLENDGLLSLNDDQCKNKKNEFIYVSSDGSSVTFNYNNVIDTDCHSQ